MVSPFRRDRIKIADMSPGKRLARAFEANGGGLKPQCGTEARHHDARRHAFAAPMHARRGLT
ncbi:hypothetical protein BVI2075_680008 [Burkholderia vietnamiensis]|nr:hypothetical protein BVI2075_680008 [Burkholderia vietnamiensis]